MARPKNKNGSNSNKIQADSQPRQAAAPPRNGTTPGTSRAINVALLLSILCVLVLGISGAVYFDQFHGKQTANLQAAAQPAAPPVNAAQNAAPAKPVPGQAATAQIPALNQINPAAGRGTPAPLQAAQPGYWVEYAAYLGPDYAGKLVKRLQDIGLRAYVVKAPGAGGKQYYSVRSEIGGSRDAAQDAALKVGNALAIDPIVHRDGQTQASAAVFTAPIPAAGAELSYWVQFGAYDIESYAKLYQKKLHDSGIDVTVIARQRPSGHVIYLVRSPPLKTPDDAQDLAQHSQALIGADTLVGQTIPASPVTRRL